MSNRLLVFLDIAHSDENGEIDEIDAIAAMRELMDSLYQSRETREGDNQMLISTGLWLGGEEGDKQKRFAALVASPELVEMINEQIANMVAMNGVTALGPHLSEILKHMQDRMNDGEDGDGVISFGTSDPEI